MLCVSCLLCFSLGMYSCPLGTGTIELDGSFSLNYHGLSYVLKLEASTKLNFRSKKGCEYKG